MQTYLQFGKAGEPMQTVKVQWKVDQPNPLNINAHYGKMSSQTVTTYKVKYAGYWYRVYQDVNFREFIMYQGARVPVAFDEAEQYE